MFRNFSRLAFLLVCPSSQSMLCIVVLRSRLQDSLFYSCRFYGIAIGFPVFSFSALKALALHEVTC